jgi:hypothetical protein
MEGEESRPLDAQLDQVTSALKASLDEACATDVRRLDTGEVIRIEQVLADASEAAKKVVTLRRKQRQSKRPRASGKTLANASATDTTTLGAHRLFVDEQGVRWDAFAVLPAADANSLSRLPEPYQQGWLCFESPSEKRRLGPIPDQWQSASDEELRRLRNAAQSVPQRLTLPEQRD